MSINPGTDLLSDALAAAEPQRAKAAEERLARLALQNTQDDPAPAQFQDVLAVRNETSATLLPMAFTNGAGHAAIRGNPYEQFEVTVLKSLFEFMLPQKAEAVFGAGFAGGVWKSMLAQSLADVAGKAGIAGIARTLEAKKQKSMSDAQAGAGSPAHSHGRAK